MGLTPPSARRHIPPPCTISASSSPSPRHSCCRGSRSNSRTGTSNRPARPRAGAIAGRPAPISATEEIPATGDRGLRSRQRFELRHTGPGHKTGRRAAGRRAKIRPGKTRHLMLFVFLLKGIAVGFVIAVPVGPVGVLCVRRTIFEGRLFWFISGLGAASADTVFGIIAGFGLTVV